jgi:hypothetical protein
MKEITLDVGFNPSSISNKSLSVVVIEQATLHGEVGMHITRHKIHRNLYEIKPKIFENI